MQNESWVDSGAPNLMTDFLDDVEALAESFGKLDARIRSFAAKYELKESRVNFSGFYPPIKQNHPTVDELVRAIKRYIISFAIPRDRRSQIRNANYESHAEREAAYEDLSDEAADLFIKAKKGDHRSGDAGELLLYLLLEKYRNAPQIVSKFYLKTANGMPVHGTDGIHLGRSDSGELCIYWGESKAHKTLSGARDSALASIRDFLSDDGQSEELRLVGRFIDVGDDSKLEEKIREYINPYNENYNKSKTVFAVLMAYNSSAYNQDELDDDSFSEIAKEHLKSCEDRFREAIEKHGLTKIDLDCFFVPLPDVQAFRDKFQQLIGFK